MARRAASSLAPLAALCALLAGCGGGGSNGRPLLDRTLANLGRIGSGDLRGSLVLTPRSIGGQPSGIEISGPFALPEPGRLPIGQLVLTRIAGPRRTTLTFVSTGGRAFVERDGKAYELGRTQVDQLDAAAAALPASSILLRQRIEGWVRAPRRAPCGSLGRGEDVECVRAGLDAEAFLSDLLGVAQLVGRGSSFGALEPAELAKAVQSGTVRVAAGRDDGLFRALAVDVDFGPTAPAGHGTLLGSIAGAHLHVELGLSAPNRPVIVEPPPNPLPLSQLGSGGG